MGILDELIEDMPQQFQGKERIEALMAAFAKQLDDLHRVFNQLDTETDLESAVGANLDMIGNIVSLTRKDANTIIRKASDYVLNDDIYRQILKYKLLKNTSDCTYKDIMGAVALLWDTSNITYKEPPDRPATVLLSMPTVSLDSIDPAIGRVLAIKPSGVAVIYTVGYWSVIPVLQYDNFLVHKINLMWKFMFLNTEYKRLDGSWLLDGSVMINGALIVPVRARNHGIATDHTEAIDIKGITRCSAADDDEVFFLSAWNRIEIPCESSADARTEIKLKIDCLEEISCSLVTKKNIWYLNESQLLNGNRYLNAIEIKEVI